MIRYFYAGIAKKTLFISQDLFSQLLKQGLELITTVRNIVEQDHRSIKGVIKPILGFKSFSLTEAAIAGIEHHHMPKKRQMVNSANMPIWKQFSTLAE